MAIKSVKYPKKGTGYLYNKLERPVKPDIYTRRRYKKDENRYKEEMDMYGLDEDEKELVRKGEYDPWDFDPDNPTDEDDYYKDDLDYDDDDDEY